MRAFLSVISFGVFILIIVVRDYNSMLFCTASVILYYLNEHSPFWQNYMSDIINYVTAICFSLDHATFDTKVYQTHVRSYIYVSQLMSLNIISSKSWLHTSISFAISNLIVTAFIVTRFDYVPCEYYIVVLTAITCNMVTLYCFESYLRKIYLMYKDTKEMKNQQSIILNLFPESLAIANLKTK